MNEKPKLGLKKGTVELFEHEISWEEYASELIKYLQTVFGEIAIDIQHIGSTAIKSIRAKPIIDIMVGINDLSGFEKMRDTLLERNIVFHPLSFPDDIVLVISNIEDGIDTNYIHVVEYNGNNWNNYKNFRDFMNNNIGEARNYERIKVKLANENKNNRPNYLKSKNEYIIELIKKANEWKNRQ